MPYYYLNDKREPVGPHTPEELSSLLRQGSLSCETEVAEEGYSCWVPLEKVLEPLSLLPEEIQRAGEGREGKRKVRFVSEPQDLKLPPLPKERHLPGRCPSCGEELNTLEASGMLPHRCPRCRRLLNLRGRGFWGHALAPLRQYACFSGRATRAECWCWMLMVGTILLLSFLLFAGGAFMVDILEDANFLGTIFQAVPPFLWSMLTLLGAGMGILTILVCALPSLALLVRRLHDVGFSGWWIPAGAAIQVVYLLFLLFRWKAIGVFATVEATGGQVSDGTVLERLISMDVCLSREWEMGFLLSYVLTLLLLAVTCIDSARGANRYGPSSRYPLG